MEPLSPAGGKAKAKAKAKGKAKAKAKAKVRARNSPGQRVRPAMPAPVEVVAEVVGEVSVEAQAPALRRSLLKRRPSAPSDQEQQKPWWGEASDLFGLK